MNDYIYLPSFSLTPNRLSLFSKLTKPVSAWETSEKKMSSFEKNTLLANLHGGKYTSETRFHNFKISVSAQKSLVQKINWLYFLSNPREKESLKGGKIFNFRMNFVTLTLPSKQVHPTSEITRDCLNQFLTELSQTHNLTNYVWRLEFQKNGNVHYHLVTDVFLDYHKTLKSWNRILSKKGYVQPYTEKHALMGLNEYVKEYSNNGQTDFETLKNRYIRGKKLNWKVPNTVDVKSVLGSKKIALYISKYFSKKDKTGTEKNELDNIENSKGLRLWFCSRSLSKLKTISDFIPAFDTDLVSIVKTAKDCFTVVHEYCTSFYFSISSIPWQLKGKITKILRDYGEENNYIPAI
jgi:hypothetical protein